MMTNEPQTEKTEEEPEKRMSLMWSDNFTYGTTESQAGIPPLALVARAVTLMDDLTTQAGEFAANEDGWIGYGVAGACKALLDSGNVEGIGVLLQGLETLVNPVQRAGWPLHEKCQPWPKLASTEEGRRLVEQAGQTAEPSAA